MKYITRNKIRKKNIFQLQNFVIRKNCVMIFLLIFTFMATPLIELQIDQVKLVSMQNNRIWYAEFSRVFETTFQKILGLRRTLQVGTNIHLARYTNLPSIGDIYPKHANESSHSYAFFLNKLMVKLKDDLFQQCLTTQYQCYTGWGRRESSETRINALLPKLKGATQLLLIQNLYDVRGSVSVADIWIRRVK